MRQLAQLAEELDTLNVVLRSATEPFDTGSAAGRMMLQMLAVFAEFEHATIVDRVTAGIERRAKEGKWATGRLPFGYQRNERKEVVPDERTAPIVKRIFDLYTREQLGTAAVAPRARRRTCTRARGGLATRGRAMDPEERDLRRPRHLARRKPARPARAAGRRVHLRQGAADAARTRRRHGAAPQQPERLPALRACCAAAAASAPTSA